MISAQQPPGLALDSHALDGLRHQAKADPKAALRAASKQLESVFLGMMLKAMRDASWDDPYFGSSENKLYTEMFDKQLTQAMAEGKGFGLAEAIYRQLSTRIGLPAEQPEQAGILPPTGERPRPARPMASVSELDPAGQAQTDRVSTQKPDATQVQEKGPAERAESPAQFIQRLWPHAEKVARELGVQPHFLLGHAALESGWGRREITLPDGRPSFNLFGIKAGGSWQGASTTVLTTEYQNGNPVRRLEAFRAYGSYEEAFRDYGELLSRRYPLALAPGAGSETFAKGLARGGYATDPLYAGKLNRVINSSAMRQALLASSQV
jgi:flagellar protein FlgJ